MKLRTFNHIEIEVALGIKTYPKGSSTQSTATYVIRGKLWEYEIDRVRR